MKYNDRIEENLRYTLNAIRAMDHDGNSAKFDEYLGLFGDMLRFYRKNWHLAEEWAYGELVTLLREPADLLIAAALECESRSLGEAAAQFAGAASALNAREHYRIVSASHCRKTGKISAARDICRDIVQRVPGNQEALSELFMCDVAERFWDLDYYDLFDEIHRKWRPRVYLEIGVATGKSLALARSGTRALGIDPATAELGRLRYNSPENDPLLYKMTSDDFFASIDLGNAMGQPCFDVGFIDGLHHFDQALRDFINLEKYASPESLILVHDCLPVNPQVATRNRTTAFWTGDVWKIIPCLRAARPDLEITVLPAAPSGLALIRRPDPASRLLERQFDSIVRHFDACTLPDDWNECLAMLGILKDRQQFDLMDMLPSRGYL